MTGSRAAARWPNVRAFYAGGLGVALGLGLYDVAVVLLRARSAWHLAASVLMASFATALPIALLGSLVLGLLLDLSLGRRALTERLRELWRAGPGAISAFVILLLLASALFVSIDWALLSVAHERIQSSRFRALASILLALGCWSLSALVAPVLCPARLASRVRPRTLLIAIASGLPLTLAGFVAARRDLAEALGLDFFLLPIAALLSFGAGLALLRRPRARWLCAVSVLGVAVGAWAMASSELRQTLAFDTVSARQMLRLSAPIGDLDGDGDPVFGGDCAPFDPARSSRAVEVVDNGIDEDCDGTDLHARDLRAPAPFAPTAPRHLVRRRPVVLISLDAVSASHLGTYGYRRKTSRNLDRRARGGVVFENAYAQGPMTRLSVPSMFTSRYPCQLPMTRRTGVTNADRLAVDTMAEMLQRAGYETVAIPGGNYFLRFRGLLQGFRRTLRRAASNTRTIETRGRFVTQDAIEELGRARQSESPTFLWIHYDDAHAPHSAVPRAPRFGDRQIDRYDQEIWLIDQELRALFTAIDDNLADRDPLVILTADHGERFDPAGRSLKRDETLLEMTLHVPLVFWMRGLSPGRVHPPAALLDILPTIVDLTGIETHSRFEGRSLVPRMRAKPRQDDRVVFSELDQAGPDVLDMVSARRDHLLLIADRLRGSRRMYDLDRDPEALRPLALRPGSLTSDIARHVQRMLTEKSRRRGVR